MLQLDGYDNIEHIGTGGMASVWRARQRSLDRDVAIKVLSQKFADSIEDVERFKTEARNCARLRHNGIVQVYDTLFQNGAYGFVMELVDGKTLDVHLREAGRFPEETVLDIAISMADALDYAWRNFGIIHCDIKPDNVMIDSDGTVKITDLGLSRTFQSAAQPGADTAEVLGTPAYTSPEQAMALPGIDCRADMYSLGAMMYHLATGTPMFAEFPQEEVMEHQVNDTVPNLRDYNLGLSTRFCDLVEKLLAKSPDDRPADWQEALADLRAVRAGKKPRSGRIPPGRSTMASPKPSDRPAKGARVVVRPHAGGKARIVIGSAKGVGGSVRDSATTLSTPRKQRDHTGLVAFLVLLVLAGAATPFVLRRMNTSKHVVTAAERRTEESAAALRDAHAFSATHTDDELAAIREYEGVAANYGGTPAAEEARNAIEALRAQRRRKADAAMEKLDAQVRGAAGPEDFEAKIAIYNSYSGPYASELREARASRVSDLRDEMRRHAESQEAAAAAAEDRARVMALAKSLGKIAGPARKACADTLLAALAATPPTDEQARTLRTILEQAASIDSGILESLARRRGSVVTLRTVPYGEVSGLLRKVDFATGQLRLERKVNGLNVYHEPFIYDLVPDERIRLAEGSYGDGRTLALGLMQVEAGRYEEARKTLQALPDPLRSGLLERVPFKDR